MILITQERKALQSVMEYYHKVLCIFTLGGKKRTQKRTKSTFSHFIYRCYRVPQCRLALNASYTATR